MKRKLLELGHECIRCPMSVKNDGNYLLHYALLPGGASRTVLLLIYEYNEAVALKNGRGETPLQVLTGHPCWDDGSGVRSSKVFDLLLSLHPAGAATIDVNGNLPIHVVFSHYHTHTP
jgi:hypothetical protein